MAEYSPIRITKRDRKQHQRLARNVRSKLKRIKDKYNIDLSDQVHIVPINHFQTRETYNRWKEDMKNFTNRANLDYQFVKNEHGIVISKRELYHLERQTKVAQGIHQRELEKMVKEDYYASGEKVLGGMHQHIYQMRRPQVGGFGMIQDFKFEDIKNLDQLKYREQMLARRGDPQYYKDRIDKMQDNWVKKMKEVYGADGEEIIEMVEELSPEDFYHIYLTHSEFNFNYHYISALEEIGIQTSQRKGADLNDLLVMYVNNYKKLKNPDLDRY